MTQRISNPAPPSSPPSGATSDERPRAPLVGIIVSVLAVGGFAAWSAIRIQQATKARSEVAAQREQDAKRAEAEAKALPSVNVVTPVPTSWSPVVEIDGTLSAAQAAELGFKAAGRLAQVRVKVGDQVKAGQLLATLDTGEASAQLTAARAQVRAAEAQLALASDTERRTTALVESGTTAEATGVQSAQQKALAAAQLDAARAQVALSEVALANHRLSAPFAGSVTRAPDGVGSVVSPASLLFEVADLTRLKLKGTLSEHDASLVKPGAKIAIETEGGPVEGTVSVVLGSVDPSTRRVRIEADVENAGERLRAGSFVRAKAVGAATIPVLRLPREALRTGGQNELFVLDGDTLASRRVVYSVGTNGELLVRHGLAPEERVVLSPKADAKPGDRVSLAAPPAPSAPAMPASAATTAAASPGK